MCDGGNFEVEKLKSQRSKGESTLPADNNPTSKMDGGCAAQAPEWEDIQRLGAEGLVTTHDINKLLRPYHVQVRCNFRATREESSVERVPWLETHQGHQT